MPKAKRQIDAKNPARKVKLHPHTKNFGEGVNPFGFITKFLALIGKPFYFVLSHLIIAIAFVLFIIGHVVVAALKLVTSMIRLIEVSIKKFKRIKKERIEISHPCFYSYFRVVLNNQVRV